MNAFAISGLLAGVTSALFGILVLWKSSDRPLAHLWSLFSISAAGWGFGALWIGLTKNADVGLLAWRCTYVFAVIWIAPFFFHFVRIFLGDRSLLLPALNYTLALIFTMFVPTDLFFPNVSFVFGQFFYARAGSIYPLYFAWWISLVIVSHIALVMSFRDAAPAKRRQIQYFFVAILVGFVGGSLSYLPNFGVDIYPWGNFSVMFYPIIMTYAILKYNLMDIRIFIRRAGLAIAVYSCLLIVAVPAVAAMHRRTLSGSNGSPSMLGLEVLFLSAVLSLGPILYAYFVRRSSFFHEYAMAGLTHELKSPLATIEAALEAIDTKIKAGGDNSSHRDYLEIIERNTSRLKGYVDELLQVYRLREKSMSFSKQNIDLMDLCRRIVQERLSLARQRKVDLHLEDSASRAVVTGDLEKIEQIVSNIVSNALKFTADGFVNIKVTPSTDGVTIRVKDTGMGISQKDLPYVFDRFFRGKLNQTARGSGIGLTIAKAWAEAHGGKIWAESEGEGKGTTVTLTLPIGS